MGVALHTEPEPEPGPEPEPHADVAKPKRVAIGCATAAGLGLAGLVTAIVLFLAGYPFGLPECVAYDPRTLHAARLGAVAATLSTVLAWVLGVRLIVRSHGIRRVLWAGALPVAIVGLVLGVGRIEATIVEQQGWSVDAAHCM